MIYSFDLKRHTNNRHQLQISIPKKLKKTENWLFNHSIKFQLKLVIFKLLEGLIFTFINTSIWVGFWLEFHCLPLKFNKFYALLNIKIQWV
jgi:hypothetical protein